MQLFKRIVRDVLLMAAVGATASVQADNLMGLLSFEDLAEATLDDFMPWGPYGGVLDAAPVPQEPAPAAPSALALPDTQTFWLLLAGLGALGLWRRRIQRRRHAGGIGAYLV